jgi:mono/diheme cytochrome c family protein
MKKVLGTIVVLCALASVGAVVFAYSGIYDVAASRRDPAVVRWLLHTTMQNSVEKRAAKVQVPADFSPNDPQTLKVGFEHYNEMCTVCHGAPGVEPGEAHAGLNPKPPSLVDRAREMSPKQLFWIIKHGVKMTGMPAWGPTHSDAKIWAMVAFVKHLPDMTAADYRAMREQADDADHGAHTH